MRIILKRRASSKLQEFLFPHLMIYGNTDFLESQEPRHIDT